MSNLAIRRSGNGTGGSGGRHKAALARLHSGGSLNRSHVFTAEGRGSSAAPTGHASFEDFAEAVQVEREIQERDRKIFLHRSGQRLDEVDFRFGLSQMFDGCDSGMCWT